jgi:hypothetical protein
VVGVEVEVGGDNLTSKQAQGKEDENQPYNPLCLLVSSLRSPCGFSGPLFRVY